ncbi:MAG: M23 family metallopeptidase [Leptolyngbyaceae cyanobacterium bins.349]|nr:M23 family metallopeptidase [Leptolyngbyaceae cyanobacterium bins.349]
MQRLQRVALCFSVAGFTAGVHSHVQPGVASLPERSLLAQAAACQTPALSRVTRHTVAAGETVERIARQYNLLPATLMGFNPSLRGGRVPTGSQILIPPFNGIRAEVQPGQSWRDVAKIYKVRPDVLFEVNGCQPSPRVVFVPGVNWSPIAPSNQSPPAAAGQVLAGSPLESTAPTVLLSYGYQVQPGTNQVAFHSGVDLAAAVGTPVLAVGAGTIAFAGTQGAYGNLVVVNHAEGLQTRYAQLGRIQVRVGQRVSRGQPLGTVGTSGRPSSAAPHLHFEVRSRSNLGWVAENPGQILQALKIAR